MIRIEVGHYRPYNRPLTDDERQGHVNATQKQPYCEDKWDNGAVIELNNTYLELTDRAYTIRGGLLFFSLVIAGMFGAMGMVTIFDTILDPKRHNMDNYALMIFATCLSLVFVIPSIRTIFMEGFALTHYPIRFNRKNRKVYLYSYQNKVVIHDWDELYFTLSTCPIPGFKTWGVYALVLDKDRQTVNASVTLAIGGFGEVRGYWEFIRAYMNEGPDAVINDVTTYLPINHKRESYGFGLYQLTDMFRGFTGWGSYFTLWFCWLSSIGRLIAMWTCRIPRWNADVNAACQVDENDPYVVRQQQGEKFSWSWFRPQYDPKRIKLAELDRRKRARAKASLVVKQAED